jgi:hypothetical protein
MGGGRRVEILSRGTGYSTIAAVLALVVSGCASTQLNYNAVEVSSSIDSVYTRETLNNLSKFIDDANAIPSQVMLVGGTIQTVNTINPSISFPLASQVARTIQTTPTALTLSTANTLGATGASVSGTNSAQQNYTMSPLNDANTLRNQRALYRHAIFGTPLRGYYHVPQVFFQDKFYDDPYLLQKPHCVLCAVEQGLFSGEQHPAVNENEALPGKWLYWEGDPYLNQLLAQGEPIDLGRHGNHQLYMSRKDYSHGVLTNFVMFTLPNSAPAEVFTPVVHVTPGTPGGPGAAALPSSTNLRIMPTERLGPALIIPQGIQPSQ